MFNVCWIDNKNVVWCWIGSIYRISYNANRSTCSIIGASLWNRRQSSQYLGTKWRILKWQSMFNLSLVVFCFKCHSFIVRNTDSSATGVCHTSKFRSSFEGEKHFLKTTEKDLHEDQGYANSNLTIKNTIRIFINTSNLILISYFIGF